MVTTALAVPVREGEVFDGKFRIERVIGGGGMGVVVAALNVALGTRVALKFVTSDVLVQPERLERLKREARAAARMESEHVVRVLDLGGLEGATPYIVLEYLEGVDLAQLVEREGRLPVVRA